jgi:hypothetical protein
LLARQPVQALVWDAWQDKKPHEFASGGLYDAAGHAKPALATLIDLRRDLIGG